MKQLKQPLPYLKITLFIALLFSITTLGLLFAGQTDHATSEKKTTTLPLPEITAQALENNKSKQIKTEDHLNKHQITIKPNDSLSVVLSRLNIKNRISFQIESHPKSDLVTRLKAGDQLYIWTDQNNQLQRIVYPKTSQIHHEVLRTEEGFNIQKIEHPVEINIVSTYGIIKDSFYLSGKRAGLNSKTIMDLADIFAWEIDFIRQIRNGNRFKVIYEQKFINGNYIGNGKILAAKIITSGNQVHTAFLLRDKNNKKIGYFDAKNRNLKKAFLRNPLDIVRITSGFNPRRFHPVLKKYRAHRGIDYAAPIGTPIRATGDGKIIRRYYDRGFGNVIFIQHANKITTVYGHMSKFGPYKKGQRVRQGTIIGYVGNTGLSTGPHLHYEFRIDGKHVDPLTVEFASAEPVPKQYLAQFERKYSLMMAKMSRLSPETQLARNFE